MSVRDEECEGFANALLKLVEFDHSDRPIEPDALARALGFRLSPRVMKGCHGMVHDEARIIRFDGRGRRDQAMRTLAHELGHIALLHALIDRPHDEVTVDRIAIALLLTRRTVRKAVREVGLDPIALAQRWPEVFLPWALLRIAWVIGRGAVVRYEGETFRYTPDGQFPRFQGFSESPLVRLVRSHGYHRDLLGAEGWLVEGPANTNAVVLLEEENFDRAG